MKPLAPKTLSPPTTPAVTSPSADATAVHAAIRHHETPLITRVAGGAKALADGTVRIGPKHTLHAIKERPVQYSLLLGGVGALGAGFMAAGVDPEPYTIGLSALVCGWSAWKAVPELRETHGHARLRLIGANIVFPAALATATTAAGMTLGHESLTVAPSGADVALAGAQSAVIGSDVPTIVQTVLDVPEGAREQRQFRRWLFRKR